VSVGALHNYLTRLSRRCSSQTPIFSVFSKQVEGTALDLRQASLVVAGHTLKPPLPAAQPPRATPHQAPLLLGNGSPKTSPADREGSGAGGSGKRGQAARSGGGAAATQLPEPAAKKRKTEAAKGMLSKDSHVTSMCLSCLPYESLPGRDDYGKMGVHMASWSSRNP